MADKAKKTITPEMKLAAETVARLTRFPKFSKDGVLNITDANGKLTRKAGIRFAAAVKPAGLIVTNHATAHKALTALALATLDVEGVPAIVYDPRDTKVLRAMTADTLSGIRVKEKAEADKREKAREATDQEVAASEMANLDAMELLIKRFQLA